MVEIQGAKAPPGLLFFAMTLLFCVGISNVAIYVTTRNVGLSSRRHPSTSSIHPPNGTQVEIYIDRVTQNDVGLVTIGGTGLGPRDKNIRFEGSERRDSRRSESQGKNDYDASSRSSLDRDFTYPASDAKSPTSTVSLERRYKTWVVSDSFAIDAICVGEPSNYGISSPIYIDKSCTSI